MKIPDDAHDSIPLQYRFVMRGDSMYTIDLIVYRICASQVSPECIRLDFLPDKETHKVKFAKTRQRFRSFVTGFRWLALSPPIFIKILGIGLLTGALFGGVAYYEIRSGMLRTHYQIHGEHALSLASSLAGQVEPMFRADDAVMMDMGITRTMGEFPDIRYIVVQDAQGAIISHGLTFPREAPSDMLKDEGDLCASCHAALSPIDIPAELLEMDTRAHLSAGRLRSYAKNGGMILEVSTAIGNTGGLLRLGVSNKIIAREMQAITRALAFSLILCMIVVLLLAVFLAFVLVQPVGDLLNAAQRLRQGEFSARANVYSRDEIGQLAEAFNLMAEGLEKYQREVEEKEEARQMLLQKTVRAQEEERKHVARELHDQLGQMLSKTLLTLDSSCGKCNLHHPHCPEIREDIRSMIEAVRQLAWNVRPSILDDYGLNYALERYVKETAKRVAFTLSYQGAVCSAEEHVASPEIEVSLYRIAQEAVTNIIRHANASHASVVLISRDHELLLVVEDNGQGFTVTGQTSRKTLGLMGMRERATLVGGTLSVDSEPSRGTVIRARIPMT